jgi:hypothetical protein
VELGPLFEVDPLSLPVAVSDYHQVEVQVWPSPWLWRGARWLLVFGDPFQVHLAIGSATVLPLPALLVSGNVPAQGPATCFVALVLVALEVQVESLEVLLEVHIVVALHIQAKTLVVLEVLVVCGNLAAPLANESQDNIHLSKLQHIPAEVVPANPAVVAASRALGPFGPFWPFCPAAALHPFWASQVLVATFSSSVAFAPTPHP